MSFAFAVQIEQKSFQWCCESYVRNAPGRRAMTTKIKLNIIGMPDWKRVGAQGSECVLWNITRQALPLKAHSLSTYICTHCGLHLLPILLIHTRIPIGLPPIYLRLHIIPLMQKVLETPNSPSATKTYTYVNTYSYTHPCTSIPYCYPIWRNSASGPEIGLPGRTPAGF